MLKSVKIIFKEWWFPIFIAFVLLFFGTILIKFFSIELINVYYRYINHPEKLDAATSGQIGDTFGGTTGPIFALIASYLTFLAFWVQYKANDQQKKDLQIERFENKFYELIQLHRNNVSEIIVGKSTGGRKAFVSMFNELKFTYLVIDEFYTKYYPYKDDTVTKRTLYNIAYLVFFFGIGPNSSKIVVDLIGDSYKGLFLCIEEHLKVHQRLWRDARMQKQKIAVSEGEKVYELDILYKPFNGHMSRFSPYIRHVFQMVKFIDESYPIKEKYEKKYNYVTTLRAQLSTHEQTLIYYNAISILGEPWIERKEKDSEHLLEKYCIIKSLPLSLADFYILPKQIFGDKKCNKNGKVLFEWYEIKSRFSTI